MLWCQKLSVFSVVNITLPFCFSDHGDAMDYNSITGNCDLV